jgi:hypothetical protein
MERRAVDARRERQVDFQPMQKHVRAAEVGMIAVCLACIVIVLVVTQLTSWGVQ